MTENRWIYILLPHAGGTQKGLAKAIGIHETQLSRLKHGKEIGIKTARKVARFAREKNLRITIDDIIGTE